MKQKTKMDPVQSGALIWFWLTPFFLNVQGKNCSKIGSRKSLFTFHKKFFRPFGPQFGLKLRVGGGGGFGPRDPPMLFDNKTSSMSTLSSTNNHDDGSTAEKGSQKITLKK